MQQEKISEKQATFFTGVSYRHIALLPESFLSLTCHAPHDITDKDVTPYLPKGNAEAPMATLMQECRNILKEHPINQKRLQNGQKPATDIWPWSQGHPAKLPSFKATYQHTGGIVTAVDLLKGLAILTQLPVVV